MEEEFVDNYFKLYFEKSQFTVRSNFSLESDFKIYIFVTLGVRLHMKIESHVRVLKSELS